MRLRRHATSAPFTVHQRHHEPEDQSVDVLRVHRTEWVVVRRAEPEPTVMRTHTRVPSARCDLGCVLVPWARTYARHTTAGSEWVANGLTVERKEAPLGAPFRVFLWSGRPD